MALSASFKRVLRKIRNLILLLVVLQFVYIIALKWIDPPITLTQLGSWLQGYGLSRDYVSKENISPQARLAVMASEDQLFPDHDGFDWKSIKKAMKHNQRKPKRVRGASTISQQVAKNVFLWQGRSWVRKGLEAYFTFMIEKVWGKERILEIYLNVAEMGKGVFGIEAASRYYYKKSAKKINRREAAQIAAILPHPKKYLIKPLSNYVSRRASFIEVQMNYLEGDPDIAALLK
ncbi:MAG: monofunctional biosynthetic peptidoglycan transglycosylase [Cyclobacteriaceae bacterium]